MADATTTTTTTAAATTLVENRDVVCLYNVTNAAYRGNYARRLPDPTGDADRLPVRILDINVAGRRVQHPGAEIRVRRTAIANVPSMRYYTMNHPVMAACGQLRTTPRLSFKHELLTRGCERAGLMHRL